MSNNIYISIIFPKCDWHVFYKILYNFIPVWRQMYIPIDPVYA